ncbi:MAG: hypothetical protein Fur009_7690 [Candidatus Microgenomates bacterium]
MEENFHKKQEKILAVIFVFLLIFFIGLLFLIFNNKSDQKINNKTANNLISPTNFPTQGKISLIAKNKVYNLRDSIVIDILGDSISENISAYDVILSYDKNLEFIKAESVFPDFQIFTNKIKNGVVLTVGKISQNNISFNNQKILSIYFKAKTTGGFFIKIEKENQGYSTKFVNDKTQILNPEINSLKINVQ